MSRRIPIALSLLLLAGIPLKAQPSARMPITDPYGSIIRGDTTRKEITLVFTAHTFADGGHIIQKVLRRHRIHAAFFLTGDFYRNVTFHPIIRQLKKDGHYLGAHSDKHLLYADWTRRDSLLVTEEQFMRDLQDNYDQMETWGIKKRDAPFFLPPYEWYNRAIVVWTKAAGLTLINFSAGTLSAADYTCPDMGARYRSSETIFNSIMEYEAKDKNGLNGFLLLSHLGTDACRSDKFYHHVERLIVELKKKGYTFVPLQRLLSPGG